MWHDGGSEAHRVLASIICICRTEKAKYITIIVARFDDFELLK